MAPRANLLNRLRDEESAADRMRDELVTLRGDAEELAAASRRLADRLRGKEIQLEKAARIILRQQERIAWLERTVNNVEFYRGLGHG